LTTKAARERLAVRHQPYWKALDAGAGVGYRKGATGGVWLVRVVDPTAGGGYRQAALGKADDALKAAGDTVFDYRQAEALAREWIAKHHRVLAGQEPEDRPAAPYTVADATTDYLAEYVARGRKAEAATRTTIEAHIVPALGKLPVVRLTRDKLKAWHRGLAAAPARLRAKAGEQRHRETGDDPEAIRRRKATANRVLTVLKAALNHARTDGKVTCSPDAWLLVKPFPEANAPKVRYLNDDEMTRLVNACPPDFRELVTGALLTGCRYGELCSLKAGGFNPDAQTVTIGRSKSGKPRHVALTDEGVKLFTRLSAGKSGSALVFDRDGTVKQATRHEPAQTRRVPWGKSDQHRFMIEACSAAKIEPGITFHELRHTYASRLAMRGTPMSVIAAQLGHSDTRMTERHYAHLSPSYVAETVRRTFGELNILPEPRGAEVRPIRRAS
jgi:integrase